MTFKSNTNWPEVVRFDDNHAADSHNSAGSSTKRPKPVYKLRRKPGDLVNLVSNATGSCQ